MRIRNTADGLESWKNKVINLMTLFVYKQDFYVVAMPSEGGRAEGKNPLGAVEKVGADHKKENKH